MVEVMEEFLWAENVQQVSKRLKQENAEPLFNCSLHIVLAMNYILKDQCTEQNIIFAITVNLVILH